MFLRISKKNITVVGPTLFLFLLLVIPEIAAAQVPFVPCGNEGQADCSACHLAIMGNSILNWLIGFMFVIFAVVMTVAGFGLVTSGGNPSALEAAKSKFVNAIVGLIIVLAAWILVDTIMRGVLAGTNGEIAGWGPWSQISCQSQAETSVVIAQAGDTTTSAPVTCDTEAACAALVDSCETDGGTAIETDNGGVNQVSCERPVGIADPGTTRLVCDVGPSGDRTQCAAQVAACESSGGTPTVNDSDETRYEVECTPASPTGACQADEMQTVNLFGFNTTVHNSIAGDVAAINAAGSGGYRVYSVGAYNCRRITGGSGYSVHAYGLAIDINSADNPYVKTSARPCPSDMPASFVNLFKSRGFGWGGDWRSVCDAMHFSDAAREGGGQSI